MFSPAFYLFVCLLAELHTTNKLVLIFADRMPCRSSNTIYRKEIYNCIYADTVANDVLHQE